MQKLLDLKPPNLYGSRMNMTDRAVTAQTNISAREKEASHILTWLLLLSQEQTTRFFCPRNQEGEGTVGWMKLARNDLILLKFGT